MQRLNRIALIFAAATLVAACGNDTTEQSTAATNVAVDAPDVSFTPLNETPAGKPQGPITVHYRIIGKPVVGQSVAIDLQLSSALGSQPIELSYRINDATAMRLAESQPQKVTMSLSANEANNSQQVTIVPMREGRLYLNVTAAIETADGSVSTVTAIPIQVGSAPRPVEENGVLGSDENGAAIRSLPGEES